MTGRRPSDGRDTQTPVMASELDSGELRKRGSAILAGSEANPARADEILTLVEDISRFLEADGVDCVQAAELGSLAADLQSRALDLYRAESAQRAQCLADFSASLRRVQITTSSSLLLERACDEARASCRLDRVLMSRVDSGHCRPWLANGEARGERWFTTWAGGDIALRELSLAHVVGDRRADLIETARRDNHDMVRLSHSTSYVAAPITASGQVVGLFHGDHGGGGRPCSESDRNLLSAFASEFSYAYERASLLERHGSHQRQIRAAIAAIEDQVRTAVGNTPPPLHRATTPEVDDLTPRELEVLGLLARGIGNQTIADTLGIDVRTVKAHVSHILAKVGATNRSQLIALAHGRRQPTDI